MKNCKTISQNVLVILLMVLSLQGFAQTELATFQDPKSRLWLNTYGNFRLKKHLFWDMQAHFRFQEKNNVPMFGQWAQIYNRQGLGYIFSKNFNVTAGGVFRLNYNLDDVKPNEKRTTTEWRIWHQYLFAMPFPRLIVYHRFRIEHRWSKGFDMEADYIFRNRYRYMLNIKIPINKPSLQIGTLYIAPEAELIMQSGKPVGGSPMENLRLHTSVGYIISHKVIVASGYMYTLGQDLSDGTSYSQASVLRLHLYYFLDFENWQKPNLPFNFLN